MKDFLKKLKAFCTKDEDKPVSRSVSQFIFSLINPPNNITYSNIYL